MSTIQFVGDENIGFYGTNQLQSEVGFGAAQVLQILGLVPCDVVNNGCVGDACTTLRVFDNDINSFLFEFADLSQSADFRLQEWVNDAWVFVATALGDGKLGPNEGTKFDLGFSAEYTSYAGYKIDWSLVFPLFGVGTYRFTAYNELEPEISLFSYPFYLRDRDCADFRADDTFKVEISQKGLFGNKNFTEDNNQVQVYDIENLTWEDGCRYLGKLVVTDPETKETLVRFANNRSQPYYSSERDTYDLMCYQITYDMFRRLRFYGFKALKVKLTDDNLDNVYDFTSLNVISTEDSNFETFRYYRLLASATLKIQNEYAQDFSTC